MLSVKQGGIKYHFLSLWYDSTWDWTRVSWSIGEHSNHYANVRAVCSLVLFNLYIGPLCATTLGQSGLGSDGNEGVLHIPQSSSINGILPSDCLVSYPGHSWGGEVLPLCREAVGVFYNHSQPVHKTLVGGEGSYPSAEKQRVYSTTLADWAINHLGYWSLPCF